MSEIDVLICITGKKAWAEICIFAAGNQLFRSTVHLKHFDTYHSHDLQLFDILVTIWELIDDRSICMFLFHNRSFNHALYIKMWRKATRIMGKIILVFQF